MSESKTLFSAVVLCYNSARYIEDCVNCLLQSFAESAEPSEILVFENGSKDGSAELVKKLAATHPAIVKALFSPTNLGTTVSRNRAITQAQGHYILVLDSDAQLNGAALNRLRGILDSDNSIGMAVPQLRYPDGRFQLSVDQFPTIPYKLKRFVSLKSMESDAEVPSSPVDVDYAISACWLMRSQVVAVVGALDEKIFYSPEDVDYCVRMWQAGYRIVYEPGAVVIHDAQELSRTAKLNRFTLRHVSGLLYYFSKHRYWFSRQRLVGRFPTIRNDAS